MVADWLLSREVQIAGMHRQRRQSGTVRQNNPSRFCENIVINFIVYWFSMFYLHYHHLIKLSIYFQN